MIAFISKRQRVVAASNQVSLSKPNIDTTLYFNLCCDRCDLDKDRLRCEDKPARKSKNKAHNKKHEMNRSKLKSNTRPFFIIGCKIDWNYRFCSTFIFINISQDHHRLVGTMRSVHKTFTTSGVWPNPTTNSVRISR